MSKGFKVALGILLGYLMLMAPMIILNKPNLNDVLFRLGLSMTPLAVLAGAAASRAKQSVGVTHNSSPLEVDSVRRFFLIMSVIMGTLAILIFVGVFVRKSGDIQNLWTTAHFTSMAKGSAMFALIRLVDYPVMLAFEALFAFLLAKFLRYTQRRKAVSI